MKKIYVFSLIVCLVAFPAFGAGRPGSTDVRRVPRTGLVHVGAPKAAVSKVQVQSANATANNTNTNVADIEQTSISDNKKAEVDKIKKEMQEKEREACLNNNIGVGNTFVWAAKDSDTSNYYSMVEDVDNPENNACFVLVGMRSDDPRINTNDIQSRYFLWGQDITCGSWVDENKMEARILDAKKSARTWGTIGGVVGGAGVGVGAMELFGNKVLANNVSGLEKLQGQKQHAEFSAAWYNAKANELNQKNKPAYNLFMEYAKQLKAECDKDDADARCKEAQYKGIVDFYSSHIQ